MITLYIDPGTGSMLISAVIALISVGFFMIKGFVYRKLNVGGTKGAHLDPSKHYGLVFYSEGKQYWNVFKPLLEECNERMIDVTYFTSDPQDPGLDFELDHMSSHFIGTGREGYYVLNRLSADMVVMTTPGLDVLEIKRSKKVKHYSHITHSPGCIAGYKAYSMDYFDSVLLGGDGDISVIAELEDNRNTHKKEVEVIGHTYLDIYREQLRDEKYQIPLFDNDRPVVLLSPTWGNIGLLSKYGKQVLTKLEQSDAFNIIVRAHPQSFISEAKLMEELMTAFPPNENRIWDRNVDGLKSMSQADIMISDFSGIIFDFMSLFEKPILTMNGEYEKRGRDLTDLKGELWDIPMVSTIGKTIYESDVENIDQIIQESLDHKLDTTEMIAKYKHVFDKYPGEAAFRGVNYISKKLLEIEASAVFENEALLSNSAKISSNVSFGPRNPDGLIASIKQTTTNLLNPNTVLQMLLAFVLLIFYILVGKKVVPSEGLNQEFLTKLLPYSILISLTIFLALILLTWVKDKGSFTFQKSSESLDLKDLLIVALPMTPIIQYIMANQDILSVFESIKVFTFFLFISAILIVLIPFILSTVVSKNLTMPISLAFVFIIYNMANFGKEILPKFIILILLGLFLVLFLILFFDKKKILIIASLIFFITNSGTSFLKAKELKADGLNEGTELIESKLLEYTLGKKPQHTPDVFLLIYESYSNQETMMQYGFDNSEQMEYLLDQNFAIYDGTYSLAPTSLQSMARVLQMDHMSSAGERLREVIGAESTALKMFNRQEYITNLVFTNDYMMSGVLPKSNFFFPDSIYSIQPHKIIRDAILEGEFRFDADFSTTDYQDYVDYKQNVLSKNLREPEFMYTHNDFPGHSQNSGVLRPNETELHIEGIVKANKEMQADIDAIRLENRDAIIIIAGDHGPYLTKNGITLDSYDLHEIDKLDIQDRYGSFLAIHWPDPSYAEKHDIKILQDVLPAVFSYMYEDESIFDLTRMKRETIDPYTIGGIIVRDGIIIGGHDDKNALFNKNGIRLKSIQRQK